jgi:hypothetical protein
MSCYIHGQVKMTTDFPHYFSADCARGISPADFSLFYPRVNSKFHLKVFQIVDLDVLLKINIWHFYLVYLESVENWKPNFRCTIALLYISSNAVQATRSLYADYTLTICLDTLEDGQNKDYYTEVWASYLTATSTSTQHRTTNTEQRTTNNEHRTSTPNIRQHWSRLTVSSQISSWLRP